MDPALDITVPASQLGLDRAPAVARPALPAPPPGSPEAELEWLRRKVWNLDERLRALESRLHS